MKIERLQSNQFSPLAIGTTLSLLLAGIPVIGWLLLHAWPAYEMGGMRQGGGAALLATIGWLAGVCYLHRCGPDGGPELQDTSPRKGATMVDCAVTSHMLATTGHEVRTHLNGIIGHVDLLAATSLDITQREHLRRVSHCSRSMLQVIDNLLDFTKLEAGHMPVEHIGFDLIDLVEQVLEMLVPLGSRKGVSLFYLTDPRMPRCHVGDPMRVRQILFNLVGNAIKFTQIGKVTVEVGYSDENIDGQPLVSLRVIDTGMGIAEVELGRIFEPYQQGHASMARNYGGTGLGLALCSHLARLLGGTLTATSELGKGSIFTLVLPLRLPLNEPMSGAGGDSLPPSVALICDAPEWRQHIGSLLEAWGVEVHLLAASCQWQPWHGPMLLFGGCASRLERNDLTARGPSCLLIDAQPSGPREPVRQGQRLLISCYCQAALRRALCQRNVIEENASDAKVPAISPLTMMDAPCNVLVVDNHPVNRRLLADQLQRLGCCVSVAAAAGEVLDMARVPSHDMVFSDLCMPGIDGYRLAATLRARGYACPIVAVTAHVDECVRHACRQAGIDMVLRKPVSTSCIAGAVGLCGGAAPTPHDAGVRPSLCVTHEMILLLRESTDASLLSLRQACQSHRYDEALSHLHAIKGAFAMQREAQVVAVCCAMERHCRDSKLGDIDHLLAQLEEVLASTMNRLETSTNEGL